MRNMAKSLWRLQARFRRLSSVLAHRDALKIILYERTSREVEVHLRPLGRKITIRFGTSDLECLQKIFLAEEYSLPFKVSPKLIIDAGANIGMATLYFANQYPNARIVAIEPENSNFSLLKRNCEGLPNIIPVQAALWPVRCQLVLADHSAEKWAFSVVEGDAQGVGGIQIDAVTIPDLLAKVGEERIDLLKIDIEGAERELFGTGSQSWLNNVRVLVIELHDRYRVGCAHAFYSAMTKYRFTQEIRAENTFINIL